MRVGQRKKKRYINPKTRRAIKRKLFFYASILTSGLLFAFFIWLSALPQFNVHKIKVEGENPIAWRLQKYLHDKIFLRDSLFFSPYNSFLLDKKELLASALQSFPEIESLDEQSASYYELNLKLKLRIPKFLICDIQTNTNPCYFSDESGFIYKTAKGNVNELTQVYIDKELLNQSSGNKTFVKAELHKEDLDNINFLIKKVQELGLKLNKIELKQDMDVYVYTNKFLIKLRKDNINFMDYLVFAKENKLIDFDNLLYVDLRFKSKIYYKEQKENNDEEKS